jgi:CheY-like chemotaxis protein
MSAPDKVNILIVDDLPEKLLVLQSILEPLGQQVIQAGSGQEALRHVLEGDFAVILLDVNMPDMDGFETAELIRRRKKSAHTPIIFITAHADELFTLRGYSLGAVDFILSPVVPDILRTKVKVFVDLFRMTQQVRWQAEERIALAQEQAAREVAEAATHRSAFLAEASSVLVRSLDIGKTLKNLAAAVVPFLADLSPVLRVDEQGKPSSAEVAWHTADNQTRQTTVPREYFAAELLDALWRALTTGQPALLAPPGNVEPGARGGLRGHERRRPPHFCGPVRDNSAPTQPRSNARPPGACSRSVWPPIP